jgi:hypothetical protein
VILISDIGNDNNLSAKEHPSIKIIKENKKEIPKLIFHEIENDFVSKQMNKAILPILTHCFLLER